MGSLELIFTAKNKTKLSSFTLIYGDGQVLERKMGAYHLKVLSINFPPPAQKNVTCPPEVKLKVRLEKVGLQQETHARPPIYFFSSHQLLLL